MKMLFLLCTSSAVAYLAAYTCILLEYYWAVPAAA